MNTFNHGDRVCIDGRAEREATVVGYSTVYPESVVVECLPTGGSPYTMILAASQLQHITVKPKIAFPWMLYSTNGSHLGSFATMENAQRYIREARMHNMAIVDVRTGEWYNSQGEPIL